MISTKKVIYYICAKIGAINTKVEAQLLTDTEDADFKSRLGIS